MSLTFQRCIGRDLDKLIDISRNTFVEAFEKDNNPEDFCTYINKAFKKDSIIKQLHNEDSAFYFAHLNGVLAGYFKFNINDSQTDIKAEDSIELERIYVLRNFQGRLIGKQMLEQVMKIGVQKNKKVLWLGVWEKNENAIRFYEKNGFVKFDSHPYFIGEDEQTDWLFRFDLESLSQFQ